ncbi:MAG TPA: murein L,D-transpeptidase catalytic domain family protein [Steroidobacteraceae bacterium]|nr:murein L,D-transpeptidase catalytic domain family protein [Steroidobacteraceae bacterium]
MIPLILGWLLSAAPHAPPLPAPSSAVSIASLAPHANRDALELALAAMRCAQGSGVGVDASRLAFIDYSRPSTEPRLWVFDIERNRLLYEEVVAHGRGSGENLAKVFSNVSGSHASSLGLFLTRDTYQGRNGYSLRMDGLEPGVNDAAMERAIVMHGAPYVDPLAAGKQGRLGRSHGCPAVREAVARGMIDVLKDGQFVFAYYPDAQWLDRSRWKCAG